MSCVCVYVYVYVCACLPSLTVKASSVQISWNTREQINDAMLKTFISYAKSFHHYFRMQHLTFLTSHVILFTHQKREKSRIDQCVSSFQNMDSSPTIVRHRLRSTLHRKPISLWRQHSRQGSQSNQERLRQLQTSVLNPVLGKVLEDPFVLIERSSIAPTSSSC